VIGDPKAFARLAAQLEAERAAAAPMIAKIVSEPERHLDAPMPPAWRTLGMANALCDAAREQLFHSPERSLYVAQLAAAIAEALPDSYPRLLRAQAQAHAWKAVATAHRFQSRHESALRALDVADRRIANEAALGIDRATLGLARATTLREMNRLAEALLLVDEAREVFRHHRDRKQVAQWELLTGMIHHRLGDVVAARQAYMRVIGPARDAGDLHTVAAAYNNLGRAAADAGDMNTSVAALRQARAIFRELEMTTESTRVAWSVAATQLAAGRFDMAIQLLQDVRRDFLQLGMSEEAGLAGVDMIEALLATNARTAARELAGEVVEEFRRAALNERALQALSFLQEM